MKVGKGKVRLLNYAQRHEDLLGLSGTFPLILNLDCR